MEVEGRIGQVGVTFIGPHIHIDKELIKNLMKEQKKTDALSAVLDERLFQVKLGADKTVKNMKPILSVSETITAIDYNMAKAKEAWYIGAEPHPDAMKYLRKVCALALQAGEHHGFPRR